MKLSNTKTRKIIDSLDGLINIAFCDASNEEKKVGWKFSVSQYRKMMELVCKCEEFTDQDIANFQDAVDSFYEHWIGMYSHNGIMNYIHMLGTGYFPYFL